MSRTHDRSELHAEAQSWVAAVERAAAAKAGAPLEGIHGSACEGLGILLMFYKRAEAKGDRTAADEFLRTLAPTFIPMLALVGLSLDELRALRPVGVA